MHVILNRTNKGNASVINHDLNLNSMKGNCTNGCLDYLIILKITFNVFMHWLLIAIRSILCSRETTDAMIRICVLCSATARQSTIACVCIIWSHTSSYRLVC